MRSYQGVAGLLLLVFYIFSAVPRAVAQLDGCQTVNAYINSDANLTTLATVVKQAQLTNFLDDPTLAITFLAPTNDAFDAAGWTSEKLATLSESYLTAVLAYHSINDLANGTLTTDLMLEFAAFDAYELPTFLAGFADYETRTNASSLVVKYANEVDQFFKKKRFVFHGSDGVSTAPVVRDQSDIQACESLVHQVDGVLLAEGIDALG